MTERIIKKQFIVKSKYPIRLFGILAFIGLVIWTLLYCEYSYILADLLMMGEEWLLMFVCFPVMCWLLMKGIIWTLSNGVVVEKVLSKPLQIVSGIENYDDLLNKVNSYAEKKDYNKQSLYLNDTGSDEYFTMFTNEDKPIEVIGVYYSDMYYAEMGVWPHTIKDIREINYKYKSKASIYIDAFCGRKEDKYLSLDISNPPKPINKILIVMINPKEKIQVSKELYNLEEWHESHVLFVVIYENKPDVLYIGPDVRLYSDSSYQYAIEELCKMLNIQNIDYHKLIQK